MSINVLFFIHYILNQSCVKGCFQPEFAWLAPPVQLHWTRIALLGAKLVSSDTATQHQQEHWKYEC